MENERTQLEHHCSDLRLQIKKKDNGDKYEEKWCPHCRCYMNGACKAGHIFDTGYCVRCGQYSPQQRGK